MLTNLCFCVKLWIAYYIWLKHKTAKLTAIFIFVIKALLILQKGTSYFLLPKAQTERTRSGSVLTYL